ncbi:MAG: J domain-containing protein [Streptosporangiales bacterium]
MTRSVTPDYYELLGVSRDADAAAITQAYRRAARSSHPDTGGNAGMFRLLQVAYETLADPAARRAYDATLDDTGDAAADDGDADAVHAQWTFADGTSRSAVFDPDELSWWSEVDPEASPRVVPPYRQGAWPAAIAVAAFLLCTAAMLASSVVAAALAVALAALVGSAYRRGRTGAEHPAVEVAATIVVLCGAGAYLYFGPPVVAPVLGAASFAAMVVAAVLAYRYGSGRRLDQVADEEAVAMVEYGTPGTGTQADNDAVGQRIGADTVWMLTALPGTRVFHGLRIPGRSGTLDHAVVCGRRVALVNSRYWEPGRYAWTPHCTLLRDGKHFAGGDVRLGDAVSAYAGIGGKAVEVRGYMLVAPSRPGRVLAATGAGGTVTVGDPLAVVEAIGAWFRGSADSDLVDRRLLVRMYERRVVR